MKTIPITIVIALLNLQPLTSFSQMSIDDFTNAGSLFSYAQDRIAIFERPNMFISENAKMESLNLSDGKKKGDTFYYKLYDYKTSQTLSYNFLIKFFQHDSLFLIPISKAAKKFYNYRKEIKFYKRMHFFDNSISFEKLIYSVGQHSSHYSDGMLLKIDSSKNVLLQFQSAFDSSKSGNFKGRLTDDGYMQLIKFLKSDNIRTLVWPNSPSPGSDPRQLVLYFNKQRKELKATGNTPYFTENLILFFNQIQNFCVLEKTKEKLLFTDN